MSQFYNAVMTNAGAALVAQNLQGSGITFTKFVTGSGEYSAAEIATLKNTTALKNKVQEQAYSNSQAYDATTVKLKTLISNSSLSAGYYMREIGVYAKPSGGTEVLFAIAVAQYADFIPPYDGKTPLEITQEFYATVANSANVVIETSQASVALAEDLQVEVSTRQQQFSELNNTKDNYSDRKAVTDLLDARMNTFIAVGSTSDNAETTDIRIGADGKIHASGGNAVREQFSDLKYGLENEFLYVMSNNFLNKNAITQGKRINANTGAIIDSSSRWLSDYCPIHTGNELVFMGANSVGVFRYYDFEFCFYGVTNNILTHGSFNESTTEQTIVVPNGAISVRISAGLEATRNMLLGLKSYWVNLDFAKSNYEDYFKPYYKNKQDYVAESNLENKAKPVIKKFIDDHNEELLHDDVVTLKKLNEDLKGKLNISQYADLTFKLGYISSSNGEENDTNLTRSKTGFINKTYADVLELQYNNRHSLDLAYLIHYYNDDYTYNKASAWLTSVKEELKSNSHYKIQVRKADQTTITDEELKKINDCFSVVNITKENLIKENFKSEVRAVINEDIETETPCSIPEYWKTELDRIVDVVKAKHFNALKESNDMFAFFFSTDNHYSSKSLTNADIGADLMKYIAEKCDINVNINGGDLLQDKVSSNLSESLASRNASLSDIKYMTNRFKNTTKIYLATQGNHDDNCCIANTDANGNELRYVERTIYGKEWSKICVEPFYYSNHKVGDTKKYYYFDDIYNKVRFICVDSVEGDKKNILNAQLGTVKTRAVNITIEQINWLKTNALDTLPIGYKIIFFSHVSLVKPNVPTLSGGVSDIGSATPINSSSLLDIINNFKSENDGVIIGYWTGHIHYDTITNSNGVNYIQTLNEGLFEKNFIDIFNVEQPEARVKGTIKELAFDVVLANTTLRQVEMIRVGAGSDRAYSY